VVGRVHQPDRMSRTIGQQRVDDAADAHHQAACQQRTLEFIEETSDKVWLYNLYNFVPYPKTPLFPSLRSRIVDWDFQHWREDQPIVYEPYHQSRAQAWDHFLQLIELATRLISAPERPA